MSLAQQLTVLSKDFEIIAYDDANYNNIMMANHKYLHDYHKRQADVNIAKMSSYAKTSKGYVSHLQAANYHTGLSDFHLKNLQKFSKDKHDE